MNKIKFAGDNINETVKCPGRVRSLKGTPQLVAMLILIGVFSDNLVVGRTSEDLLEQGRELRKRFAEFGEEFEGHDIAMIAHDDGRGRFRRSSNLDITGQLYGGGDKNIRLDLSSGKSLDLTLRHVPHINAETEIFHNTHQGRVKRSTGGSDHCFASGTVGGGGIATLSFCDEIFGMVSVDGFDYLVHPVERRSLKRDLGDDDDDDGDNDDGDADKVHIMWRRSTPGFVDGIELHSISKRDLYDQVDINTAAELMNSTELVIELALFSDAQFCGRVRRFYPDQWRLDAYLLSRIAAVQAIYGDRRKVGYDVKFKVKLLEYWDVDPEEYVFQQSLANNLNSFCGYTKNLYFYDLKGLNTGVTDQDGRAIGLASLSSACLRRGCFNSLVVGANGFSVYAHEIGHTLGMAHPGASKCPENLKRVDGFMGNSADNFSPCNKWELNKFLEAGKGSCFLVEDRESRTPTEYQDLISAFPGQSRTPDELCELYIGPGFVYYPIGPRTGQKVCERWLCLNVNESDSIFGRLEETTIPSGFPCGDKMFCGPRRACLPLVNPGESWDVEYIKAHEGISQWSEWSEGWTSCSRGCGTGVELRKRMCQKSALNLQPYCEGRDFLARLCNRQNCPDEPSDVDSLIQARADDVCSRFVASGWEFSEYLPKAIVLDIPARLPEFPSRSCMLTCERLHGEPNRLSPEAILPDGTPCKDSLRISSDVERLGIELRCVSGRCVEFSDCPIGQEKDSCGICNGGNRRCVTVTVDSSYDVPKGERALLAFIPAGASYIEVKMKWAKNRGVFLELWSSDGINVIGRGGTYPDNDYVGIDAVNHAGALWTYQRKESFLRSDGPTNDIVEIRALRGRNPITEITVSYAAPEI